jgi:hypothetical protein
MLAKTQGEPPARLSHMKIAQMAHIADSHSEEALWRLWVR